MKRKILIIIVFVLTLISFQRVEASHKTEYMSAFLATVKYIPKGEFSIDSMNENYYSQIYEVYTDGVEIIDYTIEELKDLPDGSFVANAENGNRQNTFDRNTLEFKIMVPAEEVTKDFLGNIKVYMNFYGYVHIKHNNGILEADKVKSENEQIKVLDNRHSSLTINFIDTDTMKRIEGVEVEIIDTIYKDSKIIKSNSNGQIFLEKIAEGNTKVNVRRFPINYYIGQWEYSIQIGYNEEAEYNIFLEHQKGNLEIKDNIENAVFEIYDAKGELVGKYTSDKEGIVKIDGLKIGNYLLIQKEVPNGYTQVEDLKFSIFYQETCKLDIVNQVKDNPPKEDSKEEDKGEVEPPKEDSKEEDKGEVEPSKEDSKEEDKGEVEPPKEDSKEEDKGEVEPPKEDSKEEDKGEVEPPKEDSKEEDKEEVEPPKEDSKEEDKGEVEPPKEDSKEEDKGEVEPPKEDSKEEDKGEVELPKEDSKEEVEEESTKQNQNEKEAILLVENKSNLKVLPRTGNDCFGIKVILINFVILTILTRIYFLKKSNKK